jgi:hypothetical protein
MVGYWGLDFAWIAINAYHTPTRSTDQKSTSNNNNSINKLFNCVMKKMVANLGIASRQSEIIKTFDERNPDKIRVLAYKTLPA